MDALQLDEFAAVIGGELVIGEGSDRSAAHTAVAHVSVHSGRVQPGAAFFALKGSRADGHAFVGDAAAAGASVAVVARDAAHTGADRNIALVIVDDPLRALQRLAAWWRRHLSGTVIAVVGSIGKTITKDCLVHLLRSAGSAYGAPGSYNSQLGVALALLACPAATDAVVIEAAVSDPGEMTHLAAMVRPTCVVVTNVGTRWRARFDDRAHQIRELLEMGAFVPPEGWILLGQSDDDLVTAAAARATTFVQRRSQELPTFERTVSAPDRTQITVTYPNEARASASLQTGSDDVVADVELAVSAVTLLGVGAGAVETALVDYAPSATRVEIWRAPSGVTLVCDTATPDPMAVESAIRTAKRQARVPSRVFVVLAEPVTRWDPSAPVDLARALHRAEIDGVFAGSTPELEATAAAFSEINPATTFECFDDHKSLRRALLAQLRSGDVCLVQSSNRGVDDLASLVMEAMAPTRLYVDLSAVHDNVRAFRNVVGPDVQIMGMVKALAYGTDALALSTVLQDAGVDQLGVATADEGVALRRAGVARPIVVMLGTALELEKMVSYGLTPMIHSTEMFEAVLAREATGPLRVHVEVDTGFHRAGFAPDAAIDVITKLHALPDVTVEGVMTHLACADDPRDDVYTNLQLDRFDEVIAATNALGLHVLRHAAATAATIRIPRARYDMVRIGLGLYGVHPSPATAARLDLTPAISLVSRLVHIIDVAPGERVGYGGTHVVPPGGARIGVVPAGYHDCVPRALSNFGHVVIEGVECPIVGRVSMDSMTVDVSACAHATVGSDVLIYGRLGDANIALDDVANAIGSISYEVMARVGPRVQRIFRER